MYDYIKGGQNYLFFDRYECFQLPNKSMRRSIGMIENHPGAGSDRLQVLQQVQRIGQTDLEHLVHDRVIGQIFSTKYTVAVGRAGFGSVQRTDHPDRLLFAIGQFGPRG